MDYRKSWYPYSKLSTGGPSQRSGDLRSDCKGACQHKAPIWVCISIEAAAIDSSLLRSQVGTVSVSRVLWTRARVNFNGSAEPKVEVLVPCLTFKQQPVKSNAFDMLQTFSLASATCK